jgi:hypothetical protein
MSVNRNLSAPQRIQSPDAYELTIFGVLVCGVL